MAWPDPTRSAPNANGSSHFLDGSDRRVTVCDDDDHPKLDKFGRQKLKPVQVPLRPSCFNRNVLPVNIAEVSNGDDHRGVELVEMALRTQCLLHLVRELDVAAATGIFGLLQLLKDSFPPWSLSGSPFASRAHDPTHLSRPMPFDVHRLTALDLEADPPREPT